MWILALCAPALAMSLDEAVEAAREISPVGDLSEARLAAAQAQIREADSYLKPQLDAGVGAALQNKPEVAAILRAAGARRLRAVGLGLGLLARRQRDALP